MFKSRSIRTLATYLLIGIGSVAIMAPAWLPNKPTLPLEDNIVEFLQLALLFGSAAFFFAAAPHAGKIKPIFRILGYVGILVTISEHDMLINHVINQTGLPEPKSIPYVY